MKKRTWIARKSKIHNATCAYCGETFRIRPYRIKKGRVFCPKTDHWKLYKSENMSGKNHPWYGRKHSTETKEKISKAKMGKNYGNVGEKHCHYGRKATDEAKRNMSLAQTGRKLSEETKRKIGDAQIGEKNHMYGKIGENNPLFLDGGSYDHYVSLLFDEEVRRDPDNYKRIQVKCKLDSCRKWFTPNLDQCCKRKQGIDNGASYFYCSDECKDSCSVYNQRKYPKGMKLKSKRHEIVDRLFREMVLEKDNYKCVRCEATENLKAHHIEGVVINPMVANDIDNGITFCGDCHDWLHGQKGCYRSDYKQVANCQ